MLKQLSRQNAVRKKRKDRGQTLGDYPKFCVNLQCGVE